jgi:nucleotide-binding universal stress UspA family protein
MRGTIVCGLVAGTEGRAAAELAAAIASRLDLRVVLVHVLGDRARTGRSAAVGDDARRDAEELLAAVARELGGAETRLVGGNCVDALARVAADEGADAIVLGSRARGARGRLHCGLARELEAAQSVPVLVAPPATRSRSGHRLALAEIGAGR